MRYGSLFSGIEAASLAWRPLGWTCAWVAEIDPFCRALLRHHYPDVPNLGDVTKVDWDAVEPVDVIVGGSPCQSFSVAGKRLGLDDPRGNLALVMLRIVAAVRPRWVLYENVPGLLSSDEGRDFGAFLGLLGELGYGFAYRVLDAQYGGVPQRRRRLWVVGHSDGQWQRAAAVLFDEQSLHGDPPPGREKRERIAPSLTVGAHGSSGHQYRQKENEDALIAFGGNNTAGPIEVATACNAHGGPHGRLDFKSETFITHALDSCSAGRATDVDTAGSLIAFDTTQITSKDNYSAPKPGDPCRPLTSTAHSPAVAFDILGTLATQGGKETDIHTALRSRAPGQSEASTTTVAMGASGVRRLLPIETERLMAMPDNYTLVPYRGKPAADGNRYKAIGNSMVVTEIRWLGERIEAVMRCLQETADPSASPPAT